MVKLELIVDSGKVRMRFDVPDKEDEVLKLDELAVFKLYLDIASSKLTELATNAVYGAEGFDLSVGE